MSSTTRTKRDDEEQLARIRQLLADADQKEQAYDIALPQLFISFMGGLAALTAAIAAIFHWAMS